MALWLLSRKNLGTALGFRILKAASKHKSSYYMWVAAALECPLVPEMVSDLEWDEGDRRGKSALWAIS